MESFELMPRSDEEILREKEAVLQAIEQKRVGRKAMEESGMVVEPEEEDMDMQDLKAQLADLDVELGNDPAQPRFEML